MTKPCRLPLSCASFALVVCGLAGCGKTVPPAAEPEPFVPGRSADDILLEAKLSPETAPRASLEIHRLDAYAVCNSARARLEAKVHVDAPSSGPSALTVSSLVIGGLGLAGGVVTTVLAAGLEAPAVPAAGTPSLPDAEPPDVEGKTGVIVAGVVTGVVVVGAVVGTLLLVGGGDDDDAQKHKGDPGSLALGARGIRDAVRAFDVECTDQASGPTLQACIDKARALRKTCAAQQR